MDLAGIVTTICILVWLIGTVAIVPTEAGKNRNKPRDKNSKRGNSDRGKDREQRRDGPEKGRDRGSRRRQGGTSRDRERKGREVEQLRCPPCEQLHCNPRKPSKLNCKGGIGAGICGCCPRCLKVEDELCGGKWNYLGSCDAGLECVQDVMLGVQTDVPRDQRKGICKPIPLERSQPGLPPVDPSLAISDQGQLEQVQCRPKCTPEFCANDRKAICSAVDNVDRKKSCQGECQHTSCMACEFVALEPDCGRCGRDDFRCMRQFAKCIRRQVCSKAIWPCASIDQQETSGKFQCRVPDCIPG
ncbi:cysteine-rich motor neuron 1 protein-like [Acanthaster planci]|uniref:Cysteine-rich motor neuron 1 protein-like n=1 Tax=Acanthaster planci TaxID=133434 RepID=A0A8B7ZIM5_ACAPL|nr:cysteine-rich motor neuron 1 protein-like [Acanthaster planci]